MSTSIDYQVKKKITGGYSVSYSCQHCSAALTSGLTEAGTSQPCPTCTQPFVVPGKAELNQLRAKQAADQRAKEQSDAAVARTKQLAAEAERQMRAKQIEQETAQRNHRDSHCP